MKPKLYSYFRSTSSYRVRIALHLAKLEYDYCPVHLLKNGGEQFSEDFKSLNPSEQVPFYIDDSVQLSQSMAIIDYLDSRFLNHTLFSKEASERARRISLCEAVNSGIQPLQNLSVLRKLEIEFQISEDQKQAWIQYWIEKGFSALESLLSGTPGPYSLGSEITAPDLFIVPQVYNAHRFGVNLQAFPRLKSIEEHCLKLDPFVKANPDHQPDTPA